MMSIIPPPKISAALFSEIHPEAQKRADRRPEVAASPRQPDTGTRVRLSQQIQGLQDDSSQDINIDRLNKIKAALSAGELPIDTDKIAVSLVQEIFQSNWQGKEECLSFARR